MASVGMRPGVLLVQRRNSNKNTENITEIHIKAKHGSYRDENNISPRSNFGKSSFHNSNHVPINKGVCKIDMAVLDAIDKIGLEVSKISKQVVILESEIYGCKRVSEKAVPELVEMLMAQLLKLDEIVADGDAKLLRKKQVMRVQKYIDVLDRLKIKKANNEIRSIRPIQKPLIYFL